MTDKVKWGGETVNSPCNNCVDRVLGCHAGCERYDEFRGRMDAQNAARRSYRDEIRMDIEHARRNKWWR